MQSLFRSKGLIPIECTLWNHATNTHCVSNYLEVKCFRKYLSENSEIVHFYCTIWIEYYYFFARNCIGNCIKRFECEFCDIPKNSTLSAKVVLRIQNLLNKLRKKTWAQSDSIYTSLVLLKQNKKRNFFRLITFCNFNELKLLLFSDWRCLKWQKCYSTTEFVFFLVFII